MISAESRHIRGPSLSSVLQGVPSLQRKGRARASLAAHGAAAVSQANMAQNHLLKPTGVSMTFRPRSAAILLEEGAGNRWSCPGRFPFSSPAGNWKDARPPRKDNGWDSSIRRGLRCRGDRGIRSRRQKPGQTLPRMARRLFMAYGDEQSIRILPSLSQGTKRKVGSTSRLTTTRLSLYFSAIGSSKRQAGAAKGSTPSLRPESAISLRSSAFSRSLT